MCNAPANFAGRVYSPESPPARSTVSSSEDQQMTRRERSAARFRIRPSRLTAAGRMWLAAFMVPLCLASASYGQTTYQVVKGFDAPSLDGGSPYAGVLQAADGSFYGT